MKTLAMILLIGLVGASWADPPPFERFCFLTTSLDQPKTLVSPAVATNGFDRADWGPAYAPGMEHGPASLKQSAAAHRAEAFMAEQEFASQFAKRACVISGSEPIDVSFALLRDPTGTPHGVVRVNMTTGQCSWLGASVSGPAARANVTGVVVDTHGKPVAGVLCSVCGWPLPSGGRNGYTGIRRFIATDQDGRFTIPIPRGDPLVDLEFDDSSHAPVFVYDFRPADSPLKVRMADGKLLRGRVVERVNGEFVPIPHVEVELQMPQEDFWYQHRQTTSAKGEFQFRISEPPGKISWALCCRGERFPIEYAQVAEETVMVLDATAITPSAAGPDP